MNPERWQRAKELFGLALERRAAERGAFLEQACTGDDELRGEVSALLDAHDSAGSFLEIPATMPAASAPPTPSRVGERVGAYELRRVLGEGGMGTVYQAVRADGQFAQDVAVKLLRRGVAGDEATRRFRAERQILARLEHPNIARLLDGGTTAAGQPYFVMELVEGQPIDAWCAARAHGPAALLALFLPVCDAVSYAHQRLVIHRDIKPSNILVGAAGVPKLLDFGIAKLAGEDGDLTQAHERPMTPRYASPEQLRGEAVTTATDVHALGILLYTLLAGRHPYGEGDSAETARRILDEEPARPSEARGGPAGRALRGDIDNIVLMALAKDPARRYPSADKLADDLRRHLDGLPVSSRAATLAYRAGKLLRRHWLEAGALAAVFAALVAGVVVSSWQARVAAVERARAERRFEDVRHLADAMLFELHDAIADLPGSTAARALLVKRALAYLAVLEREASHDAALALELAAGYRKLGDVQGNPAGNNLGDPDGALASYRKALAVVDAVLAADRDSAPARHERARLLDRRGDMRWYANDLDGAVADYQAALEVLRPLAAAHPDDAELRRDQAGLLIDLGDTLTGDASPASYRRAIDVLGVVANDPAARRLLSIAWLKLGDLDLKAGQTPAALQSYRTAMALREAALAESPRSAPVMRDFSSVLTRVGNAQIRGDDLDGGLQSYRRALAIDEAHAALDPLNARARRDVAVISIKIADLEERLAKDSPDAAVKRQRWEQEREDYLRAVAALKDMDAKGGLVLADQLLLGEVEVNLVLTYMELARLDGRLR